jgi:hypothetical protein
LTIGPGVTLAFGNGEGLQVGNVGPGGLIVQGTSCAPVVFTTDVAAAPKAGDWGTAQLDYQTLGTSSISNLILQYGGNDGSRPRLPASLLLDGQGGDFTVPLSNVTVSNNYAGGIAFYGPKTSLSSTSTGTLTVTDWPATADPFTMDFNVAGTLSAVTLSTGSTAGGFVHLFQTSNEGVTVAEHWPSIAPLAYVLGETDDDGNVNIDSQGGAAAIVTIDAPNTLRLGSAFTIVVDDNDTGLGGLVANGAAGKPIVFTSLSGLAEPGAWSGIELNYPGTGLSSISDVTIDSAGTLSRCSGQGAIYLVGTSAGNDCVDAPTLTNITFTNLPSGAAGILATNVSASTATALGADGDTAPSANAVVYTCPESPGNWQCQ